MTMLEVAVGVWQCDRNPMHVQLPEWWDMTSRQLEELLRNNGCPQCTEEGAEDDS